MSWSNGIENLKRVCAVEKTNLL